MSPTHPATKQAMLWDHPIRSLEAWDEKWGTTRSLVCFLSQQPGGGCGQHTFKKRSRQEEISGSGMTSDWDVSVQSGWMGVELAILRKDGERETALVVGLKLRSSSWYTWRAHGLLLSLLQRSSDSPLRHRGTLGLVSLHLHRKRSVGSSSRAWQVQHLQLVAKRLHRKFQQTMKAFFTWSFGGKTRQVESRNRRIEKQ